MGIFKRIIKNRLIAPFLFWGHKKLTSYLVDHFKQVAQTGVGSDLCLKKGFLPLPIHFYSPIPDLEELESRRVWDRKSELAGLNFNCSQQGQFLQKVGREFGDECHWPPQPVGNEEGFFTENGSFSFGCAASTHCMIRHFKPAQVIEIGSGNSSKVILDAIQLNRKMFGSSFGYTIVDPYPKTEIEKKMSPVARIIKQGVEIQDLKLFEELNKNDILFIDSGHTVRTGSDVNFLILEVLPRLSSGVVVHFHDIGLPYEYPKVYATNPHFRMFWTEAYLLQSFLCLNRDYEILLPMGFLMTERIKEFQAAFPHYDPQKHLATSGSFWIRRVGDRRDNP